MAKVEPEEREKVYECFFSTSTLEKIQEQYPEKEVAYVDTYVNCHSSSSWQRLVRVLYRFSHMAAVEEVKAYLPPRGESPSVFANCQLREARR